MSLARDNIVKYSNSISDSSINFASATHSPGSPNSNTSSSPSPFPPMVFSFSPLSNVAKTLKVTNFANTISNSINRQISYNNVATNVDKQPPDDTDRIKVSHVNDNNDSSVISSVAASLVATVDQQQKCNEKMSSSVDKLLQDYDNIGIEDAKLAEDGHQTQLADKAEQIDSCSTLNDNDNSVIDPPKESTSSLPPMDKSKDRLKFSSTKNFSELETLTTNSFMPQKSHFLQTSLPNVIITTSNSTTKEEKENIDPENKAKVKKGLSSKEIAAIHKSMGSRAPKNKKHKSNEEQEEVLTNYAADNLGYKTDSPNDSSNETSQSAKNNDHVQIEEQDNLYDSLTCDLPLVPPTSPAAVPRMQSFLHGSASQRSLPLR